MFDSSKHWAIVNKIRKKKRPLKFNKSKHLFKEFLATELKKFFIFTYVSTSDCCSEP